MASASVKDTLVLLKKRLERAEDDKTILHTIHKLSKFPMTLDILQGTGAGKVMRSLAKRPGEVGIKATSLLNKWRQVVADSSQKSDEKEREHSKKSKHSKNNHESFNKGSSHDIGKQSAKHEKHSKDKHDKMKHSKEKHSLKTGHKDHTNSPKMNGNAEKESKKYLKDTSNHSNKNSHTIKSSSKYNYEIEDSGSDDYMDSSYNPNHPEIYPLVKHSSKREREDSKMNNHSNATVTYEPSPKKPKLDKPHSPEQESVYSSKKQINVSNSHHSSDSLMKHSKDNDNFHKKKSSKSSKDDIQKNGHLTEKSSKNSDNIKKVKNKDGCKAETKKTSKKIVIQNAEEFTASEASFEDCLSFNDILPISKRKSSKFNSSSASKKAKNITNERDNSHKMKNNSTMPLKSPLEKNKICDDNTPEKLVQMPSAKYKEVDMVSKTLPQPLPNYRPLPQRSYDDPAPIFKKKVMSNEEAIKFTSSRREKTAVYSGRKNHFLTEVPSLFECCTRVLIENIDDIEYMGEIPFFLLESMLRRCTPMQLYRLEHFNPYLLEDTNELWEIHCRRDYRTAKPQENETWRELYWRSHDEQEQRLRSVTANITASIANSNPVRKAKLAYIDAVVKPPREVARRQAKNGTALLTSHAPKAVSPSKSSPKPVVPAIKVSSRAPAEYKPQKPKVAPLMAKTLKSMKQCFRR